MAKMIICRENSCRKFLINRREMIIEHVRRRYNRLASSFVSAEKLVNFSSNHNWFRILTFC